MAYLLGQGLGIGWSGSSESVGKARFSCDKTGGRLTDCESGLVLDDSARKTVDNLLRVVVDSHGGVCVSLLFL